MQLFFNKPDVVSYSIPRYAQWDYVRAGLLRNLETTQKYYHSRIFAVKSNHFLCRLINTINVSHNLDIERYYSIADARATKLCAAMKITTSSQRGGIFNGIFYGPGCPEIILLDNEPINPEQVYKDWRQAQAVKVVTHPRTDYSLMLPNGRPTGADKGLVVISINIGMLAVQYRAFAADQMYQDTMHSTGLQTVAHFVHRYVLSNMLPSHLDLVVFNRLAALLNGAPLSEPIAKHPFSMPEYSSASNVVHEKIIADMEGKNVEYPQVLATIPGVVKNTMREALVLPENPPTRQISWAEVLGRIEALKVVIKLAGKQSVNRNTSLLNDFASEFKYYQSDKAISSNLPRDMYSDALYAMKEISEMTGKKLLSN
jgi:hypothetical protein